MAGWQRSRRRPPRPQDDDFDDVDENHDDNDGEDDYDHRGAVENEYRRERRVGMLPGTVGQHNDSVCGGGDGGMAKGGRSDFCGIPQRGPGENGQTVTRQRYCSGGGDDGA